MTIRKCKKIRNRLVWSTFTAEYVTIKIVGKATYFKGHFLVKVTLTSVMSTNKNMCVLWTKGAAFVKL